jgi:hypothetical protein
VGGSSRSKRSTVKAEGAKAPDTGGFSRHFEGWQPGLLAIFLAGSSALIAVPRSVDASLLPEPSLSPRALAAAAQADDALAAQAAVEAEAGARLDFDVRALGSAIRAYGVADAEGNDTEIVVARQRVAEAAKRARLHGEEPLAKLRAFQLEAFLRALRHWEARGIELPELRELGGGFVAMAARNDWIDDGLVALDGATRRALFKKRWNELTLLRGERLDLSLDEQRVLYRFLLRRPPREDLDSAAAPRPPRGLKASERGAYFAEQYRMRKIDELAALDPTYPADFARGVVLYRLRRSTLSAEMFRRHLEAHPDGPLTLRAQNHLRAALGRVAEEGP